MIITWKAKSVLIKAVQWTGDNQKEVETFLEAKTEDDSLAIGRHLKIVPLGSYITQDGIGGLCAIDKKTFLNTYERHLVWDENL